MARVFGFGKNSENQERREAVNRVAEIEQSGRAMKSKRAGIQGELGAFSQEAARQLLGPRVEVAPYPTFNSVFTALGAGKIHSAVIPMENTLAGSVHENYDHLLHFDVRIAAETNVRIVHNLIAPPGVRFRDLRKVYSHPVALDPVP